MFRAMAGRQSSTVRRIFGVTCGVLLLGMGAEVHAHRGPPRSHQTRGSDTASRTRIGQAYGALPMSFESNRGQTDPRVKFLARGSGYTVFLTPGQAALRLRMPARAPTGAITNGMGSGPETMLRMGLVGANHHPRLVGRDRLPGTANYFLGTNAGRRQVGIPTYGRVLYGGVYPGVDLIYHGTQGHLEFDFVLAPGADPRAIALRFRGAGALKLDAMGAVVLNLAGGDLRLGSPVIYQEVNGVRREIPGSFTTRGRGQIGFRVGAYDTGRPLVIDPTLFYSTYLGGSGFDQGNGIAVDAGGNAFVTGRTDSIDFPTVGATQPASGGLSDAFVAELNATGSSLVYSTYLGGSGTDQGNGIALDAAGNAYVTGQTNSTDIPASTGAFQPAPGGGSDAFVAALNATGSLLFFTYLGGGGTDQGYGIAVDGTGAYVAGLTGSTDFPTTLGAFQPSAAGGTHAFVTKLNSVGTGALYSTYLEGNSFDAGYAIAVHAMSAYVTGQTFSTNFPTTSGAFQSASGGGSDVFITAVNPTGTGLGFSTYLGGANTDSSFGIASDATGNAYVTGRTDSSDFPFTAGAFQTSLAGGVDAFVTKVSASGGGVYSTYLGGGGTDQAQGIAVDAAATAYVTGLTGSNNFPTADPIQSGRNGSQDAFVTNVNATGTGLTYSTYLGGNGSDQGQGIALDSMPSPDAYVTGLAGSADFPTMTGAFQPTYGGSGDAFVAKIANVVMPPPPAAHKLTGGGSIAVSGGTGTFGFIVQEQDSGQLRGQLQYVNHVTGAKVQSVTITSLTVSGNTATFSGTCTNNGVPRTFTVNVIDNGEPGKNDSFTITVTPPGSTEGGTLRSGNIQIHF